jgi:dihydrolipoamide dehydrogenase
MATRFLVIGGGPAGQTAASVAAGLGADVTIIERDVLGGAAHLWDCVPSKAMIATGGELMSLLRSEDMGIDAAAGVVDVDALRARMRGIQDHLRDAVETLLASQGVRMLRGTGRLASPTTAVLEHDGGTETVEFDAVLLSTGSRPRVPDWVRPDGDRVLTTRDAYPPPVVPEHVVVVGSGVTGVEFAHMFTTFGARVSLVVSRQQVLPTKDPEVAATLEDSFLERGVELHKGHRHPSGGRRRRRGVRGRPGRARLARTPRHRVDPELGGTRARDGGPDDHRVGHDPGRPQLPHRGAGDLRRR